MQRLKKNDCIHEEAAKICKAFKPVGPLNIQLRLDKDNNPICFELNVRFSGTTAMRTAFGFRDVEAMIKEYVLHEDIDDCFDIKMGEIFRYDNEMYIYMDAVDLMEKNGKIPDLSVVNKVNESI